jgi:pyruvyl transferase EpsO
MAFYISNSRLGLFSSANKPPQKDKTLFLKRRDKELNTGINYFDYIPEKDIDIHDWLSMEKRMAVSFLLRQMIRISRRIPVLFPKLTDIYAEYFFKPAMIKSGVRFLSAYNKIYTTRLHAAILCCLLEKRCILFDNSYGKNSGFFNTWLKDLDGINFIPAASSN